MTFWQILALDWYVDRKIKKTAREIQAEKAPPVSAEERIAGVEADIENGQAGFEAWKAEMIANAPPPNMYKRKTRVVLVLLFCVLAIACFLILNFLFGFLFLFAAAFCTMFWPHKKQSDNTVAETP